LLPFSPRLFSGGPWERSQCRQGKAQPKEHARATL